MAENTILSWHDALTMHYDEGGLKGKASFRDAYFFVRDTGTSFGRRNIIHQYPKRNTPYIEDIGSDTDQFTIQGYVVQNLENDQNYFEERNALIEALKKEGPGQLWHPFLGIITVSLVGKAELTESFQEGGIARFSMTFIRAEEESAPFPKAIDNYVTATDEAVSDAEDNEIDSFGENFDAEDEPNFIVDSVSSALGSLNKMLASVTIAIQGAFPAQISDALTTLANGYEDANLLSTITNACSMASGILNMGNGLLSLIGSYGDILQSQLLGECSGAIRGLSNGPWGGAQVGNPAKFGGFVASTISNPAVIGEDYGLSVTRAVLKLTNFGESPDSLDASSHGGTLTDINITTASRARESANQVALVNMVRFVGISTAMKSAIRINFTSHDTVIEIMDEIIEALNEQLLKLGNEANNTDYIDYNINISSPKSYESLESLKKIFTKSMLSLGTSLTDIIEYELNADVISSLTVAYDKYKDLDREAEIIYRNKSIITHPGFLPNGKELEILNA